MATKPTVLPVWADSDQTDPTSGQNNVLTPPPDKQQYGWNRLEFPPRNWFNWLGRYTYRWLAWLKQQEEQAVVTNGSGVGLFVVPNGLIFLYAVDKVTPANYVFAMGYKASGVAPVLTKISNNVLDLGVGTISGNQPITGGTSGNVIAYGQTKIIP